MSTDISPSEFGIESEDPSLSNAHGGGIAAYERRIKKGIRVDVTPPNPYGEAVGATEAWAWELGWRMMEFVRSAQLTA